MNHSFNVEVAEQYGIEEAIILENLYFWCAKNAANQKHIKNGKVWTYNSVRAFNELFPYMTEAKIYRVLKHLEEEGLVEIGCFNINGYDRTKWYTVTNEACKYYDPSIFQNEKSKLQSEESILQDEESNLQNNKMIMTDINTYKNTDVNADDRLRASSPSKKPTLQEVTKFYHDNQLEVTPERFLKYMNDKNWKDKKGKPIYNWQAVYLSFYPTPDEEYDMNYKAV